MVRSKGNMSLKNPVTPPGIDPGTVRLIARRINHYVIPGPTFSTFFLARQTTVGPGLLIHEVSRSHTTPQSVGLLWTSDQLVAETSI